MFPHRASSNYCPYTYPQRHGACFRLMATIPPSFTGSIAGHAHFFPSLAMRSSTALLYRPVGDKCAHCGRAFNSAAWLVRTELRRCTYIPCAACTYPSSVVVCSCDPRRAGAPPCGVVPGNGCAYANIIPHSWYFCFLSRASVPFRQNPLAWVGASYSPAQECLAEASTSGGQPWPGGP